MNHPVGCGHEVLHVGVVIWIKKQTIMVESKEGVTLGVLLYKNRITHVW